MAVIVALFAFWTQSPIVYKLTYFYQLIFVFYEFYCRIVTRFGRGIFLVITIFAKPLDVLVF